MRQTSNSIARFIGRFAAGYLMTAPAILLVCGALFYRRLDALAALPVLAVGWAVVVAATLLVAHRVWVVTLIGVMFYLIFGHILSGALLQERLAERASINYGSDDDYYISMTQFMRPAIREAPWALSAHWDNVSEQNRGLIAVSLRGYPFALAYLFAWLPDDADLHYVAAVCVNLILLCLLYLAVLQAVSRICGAVDSLLLLAVFATVCLNLFLEASQCRKDVMLNLIVFTACVCAAPWAAPGGKLRARPILALFLLSGALLTIRPVYLVLPVVMLGTLHIGRLRKLPLVCVFILGGMLAAVFVYFYLSDFTLRGIDLLGCSYGQNQTVLQSGGMAARVYALPFIGPFLYYLFLPFPRFDAGMFSIQAGVMNAAFVVVVAAVICIGCHLKIIWRNIVLRSIILLSAVFIFMTDIGATLLDDPDPRYKAVLLPLLCVVAYCGCVLPDRRRPVSGGRGMDCCPGGGADGAGNHNPTRG